MKLGAARDQSVRMAMPVAPPDTLAALGEAGGVMPFATPSSSRPRRPPPELSFSGPHNAVRKIVGHRSDISLLDLGPRSRRPVLTAVPLGGERGASSRSGTESSQTRRWREVDSNHRYRPAIATELQARCVPDDMWMPVP